MDRELEDVVPLSRRLPLAELGWRLLNGLQLAYTLAWTAGWISIALLLHAVTRSQRASLALARRVWAPGLLWGAGVRLEVVGRDRVDWTRAHVLLANHSSMIDICVLFRAVPVPLRFLLKEELVRVPFLGRYTVAMGMERIYSSPRASVASLRRAAKQVHRGATFAAFPEGTRVRSGSVETFHGGACQVAIEAQAPVVPVAISGAGDVLPTGGFRARPGRIRVTFGEPVSTTGMEPRERSALADRARTAVLALLEARPEAR